MELTVEEWQGRYALGDKATNGEATVEAAATPDDLLVSSPATVIGPHTPKAAASRRAGQKLLISDEETCGKGLFNST